MLRNLTLYLRPDLPMRAGLLLQERRMRTARLAPHPAGESEASAGPLPPRISKTDKTLQLLLTLRGRFLSFIERRVSDAAVAEDILQSAYLRILNQDAGNGLRETDSAVAWFYRILRNAIVDHYRRRAAEAAAFVPEERWVEELATAIAPDPVLQQAACACIGGVLDLLPLSYATLLREVDLAEGSLTGYAKAHGITPGNAAVRAHRARAALRKGLIRCCGACAAHGCLDCTCLDRR